MLSAIAQLRRRVPTSNLRCAREDGAALAAWQPGTKCAHVDVWQPSVPALLAQLFAALSNPGCGLVEFRACRLLLGFGRGARRGRRRRRCGVRGSRPRLVSPPSAARRRPACDGASSKPSIRNCAASSTHTSAACSICGVHELGEPVGDDRVMVNGVELGQHPGAVLSLARRWAATGSHRSPADAVPARICPPEAHHRRGRGRGQSRRHCAKRRPTSRTVTSAGRRTAAMRLPVTGDAA